MTGKRATLWKTSLRRQKSPIGSAPQDMYWFVNFQLLDDFINRSFFSQPLDTPAIGDSVPPFWMGAILGSAVPESSTSPTPVIYRADIERGANWSAQLDYGFEPSLPNGSPLQAISSVEGSLPLTSDPLPQLGAGTSPLIVRATVIMLVVEPSGSTYQSTLWVDGTIRKTQISPVAYTANPGLLVQVNPGSGLMSSMAGGNALPTAQEIQDWFFATRYASPYPLAQQIPGKTLDQYDAANTPGVVPAALTNLSTGQNAPLGSNGTPPIPANFLLSTTFGY